MYALGSSAKGLLLLPFCKEPYEQWPGSPGGQVFLARLKLWFVVAVVFFFF